MSNRLHHAQRLDFLAQAARWFPRVTGWRFVRRPADPRKRDEPAGAKVWRMLGPGDAERAGHVPQQRHRLSRRRKRRAA